jgi:integrase
MNAMGPLKKDLDLWAVVAHLAKKPPKYTLLLHLGIFTGLRISDLLRLRVSDVLSGTLTVTEQKTGKERSICLTRAYYTLPMLDYLEAYISRQRLHKREYLIFSTPKSKNKPLSRVQAWRVLRAAADAAWLEAFGPHSLRKTFAIRVYHESGKDFQAVQRELAHDSAWTTMRYLVEPNRIAELLP